jgi:hypothetical protein
LNTVAVYRDAQREVHRYSGEHNLWYLFSFRKWTEWPLHEQAWNCRLLCWFDCKVSFVIHPRLDEFCHSANNRGTPFMVFSITYYLELHYPKTFCYTFYFLLEQMSNMMSLSIPSSTML